MNRLKLLVSRIITIAATFIVIACSGGGGDPPSSNVSQPGSTVSDLILQLDKTSISNSGGQSVAATITALDAARNVVSGTTVSVMVDQNAIFTSSSSSGVTDNLGKYTGTIDIGSDKSDRLITVTAKSGVITKTAVFVVVGSTITTTFVPSAPQPGQLVTANIKVKDANGIGIPGVILSLSGISGLPSTLTSDAQGTATTTFNAPSAGSYSVTVTGSGINPAPFPLTVVPSGGGSIPNATTPANLASASISITPTVIGTNTSGSTSNRAQLKALFQTAGNQGIQNMRVRFDITGNPLGSGESVSSGQLAILSDISGIAIADYIAGTRSSPTNGVEITMCYSEADFVYPACPNSKKAYLTITGSPLSVTIGSDNLISKDAIGVNYIKKYAVLVADSAGVAVSNAPVSISVDLIDYITGYYSYDPEKGGVKLSSALCANEDTNRNGVLDAGEDINSNGTLEPRKADLIVSYANPAQTSTDATGVLYIQVTYPQNVATWLRYTLKASVNASGSEGTDQKTYTTNFLKGDGENGSFRSSPYGRGTCTSYIPN